MDNKDFDILLRKAQDLGRDIKKIEAIDTEEGMAMTRSKISKQHRQRFMMSAMRYAAILAVPLLLSTLFMVYVHFFNKDTTIRYAEVKAASGSVIRYELPDNSVVWLNSGSTLKYPTAFDKTNRQVYLHGEAYFEVTANKKSPFYVNTTSGLKVYVYGTRFNVSTYDDDNMVETTLEEGHVNVILPFNKTAYKINPGENISYDRTTHAVSVTNVDVYERTAWKDNKLVFRDSSLAEVLKLLSRHFNVDITLHNHSQRDYRYHATFRGETLPQILTYLSKSVSMKWKVMDSVQQDDDSLTKEKIIVDLY